LLELARVVSLQWEAKGNVLDFGGESNETALNYAASWVNWQIFVVSRELVPEFG